MNVKSHFCSILPAPNHHPQYFYRHRLWSRRQINHTIHPQSRRAIGSFINSPVTPNHRCLIPTVLSKYRLLPV